MTISELMFVALLNNLVRFKITDADTVDGKRSEWTDLAAQRKFWPSFKKHALQDAGLRDAAT